MDTDPTEFSTATLQQRDGCTCAGLKFGTPIHWYHLKSYQPIQSAAGTFRRVEAIETALKANNEIKDSDSKIVTEEEEIKTESKDECLISVNTNLRWNDDRINCNHKEKN